MIPYDLLFVNRHFHIVFLSFSFSGIYLSSPQIFPYHRKVRLSESYSSFIGDIEENPFEKGFFLKLLS